MHGVKNLTVLAWTLNLVTSQLWVLGPVAYPHI